MVESSTVVLATATIIGSLLGSLTLVEFRVRRERMAQERAERVQWCKKAATLSEQVHIECTDLQGRLGGQTFAELEESGTLDELRERIQRLKDHQAEQPLNADSDADYFLTDVWTKYAMLNTGSAVTINDINEYPMASAEQARNHFQEQAQEHSRSRLSRLRSSARSVKVTLGMLAVVWVLILLVTVMPLSDSNWDRD
jgi:hypothetical protein